MSNDLNINTDNNSDLALPSLNITDKAEYMNMKEDDASMQRKKSIK